MSGSSHKKPFAVLVPDWQVPAHVLACTTLRQTVDSHDPYSGFNLATHVGDDPAQVQTNRNTLSRLLALPGQAHWLNQIHSNTLIEINESKNLATIPTADAVFTTSDDVVCAILTADCLPILVTDTQGRGVAAIHAGWRGLADGIIKNTIEKFCSKLNIKADECVVWLGPAISQTHFEVGIEVYEAFTSKHPEAHKAFIKNENKNKNESPKYHADLYHLARLELHDLGVTQISGGDQCTYAQHEDFYSHRRHTHQRHTHLKNNEHENCGRMATLIWLNRNNRE